MSCAVSIIIPTFNRNSLLRETLQSVQNQTFLDWECIIVDDGGNDATCAMIEKEFQDSRIFYLKRPSNYPKGASSCRNYGFEKSTGRFLQWLDDDDLLSPNKLEVQMALLKKIDNSRVFSSCSWDLFWPGKQRNLKNAFENNQVVKKEFFFRVLERKQTFMPALAYLTPRFLIEKSGLWNTNLTINDDAEFFTRILINSNGLVHTTDCYVLYREHELNRLSRKKDYESFFQSLRLINSSLESVGIHEKKYFRWKMLKAFYIIRKDNPGLIDKNKDFLIQKGINPSFTGYYLLRKWIYQKVYPLYKYYLKRSF